MQAVAKYASPLIGWGTQVVLSLSGVQSPVLAVAVWVFIAALIWWAWLTPSVNAGLRWARAHGFLDLTETGEAHLRLGALGVGAVLLLLPSLPISRGSSVPTSQVAPASKESSGADQVLEDLRRHYIRENVLDANWACCPRTTDWS